MTHRFHDEGNGILCQLEDQISLSEIMAAVVGCAKHPNNADHLYQLWDFTAIDGISIDDQDASSIGKSGSHALYHEAVRKVALISNRPDLDSLVQAYLAAIDTGAFDAALFRTEEEARRWLAE